MTEGQRKAFQEMVNHTNDMSMDEATQWDHAEKWIAENNIPMNDAELDGYLMSCDMIWSKNNL